MVILRTPASTAIIGNHFARNVPKHTYAQKTQKKGPKWPTFQVNLALYELCFGTLLHAMTTAAVLTARAVDDAYSVGLIHGSQDT